ncbi:BTAD domain-containing putative transcriptional regulator [Streptomyces sp. NPDC002911]
MRFTVLGPMRAWADGSEVPLGPPQQRAVLAILLLRHGRPATVSELVDGLWGERPPTGAVGVLRTYVSRLRRALEPIRAPGDLPRLILSAADGYLVDANEASLDLDDFETETALARRLISAGDLAEAGAVLAAALDRWDGVPLAGVPGGLAETERARLTEQRMSAVETRLSVDIALGGHAGVIGELASLREHHPVRERLTELLMLALYGGGRQAEALDAYRATRQTLAEEFGVEPGPGLREIHRRMLDAEPLLREPLTVLFPGAGPGPEGGPGRRSGHDLRRGPGPAGSPAVPRPDGIPVVRPSQLPADLPVFAGRHTELGLVARPATGGPGHPVVAISGMAGIGKTALAVHWAHSIADRFTDGQLFVDLRGFDPGGAALEPEAVVRLFLGALGLPPERIPADVGAQVALYRSLLATRRVLVVLDNARDTEQIRPLLPGTGTCSVIVTSRTQLHGLVAGDGARPLVLGLMTGSEAGDVLARRIGTDRTSAEPGAVEDIVRSCGRLPLALAVVAARAAMHPHFPLAAIAAELRDGQGSLDAFSCADPATDPRAVFSWSYCALPPATARLFRLLSLHAGPDISVPAAAALATLAPRQAHLFLADLARGHLLTEVAPGRYVFHDLLLAYAAELAQEHDSEKDRREAAHRLLDHLLLSALAASARLCPEREKIPVPPGRPGSAPEQFTDPGQALQWLRTELRVLCSAVPYALDEGYPTQSWQLAFALDLFLDRFGHWHDSLAVQRTGLEAATRSEDPAGRAHTHRGMGFALVRLGRPDAGRRHLETADELYEGIGDLHGRARTHRSLAFQANREGAHDEAHEHYRLAHTLYEAAGDRSGRASVLNETGWTHILCGRYDEAVEYCNRALALHAEVGAAGGVAGEAAACDSLGQARHRLGEHSLALGCHRRALSLYRQLGDRILEAAALAHIGDAEHALGHGDAARRAWQDSVAILEEEAHPEAAQAREKLRSLDIAPTTV